VSELLALGAWLVATIVTLDLLRSNRRLHKVLVGRTSAPRRSATFVALRRGVHRSSEEPIDREAVADLVGRLAALTRAGVAPARAWQVLATGEGPVARVARVTSDMVSSGGSPADGLRLAVESWPHAPGPPGAVDAVGWLALATEVIDRSGAPSAAVYDGRAAGVLAELARIDEQEVALASARATTTLLAALPLVGAGLGFLMGANVVGVLIGTPIGRVCLVLGLAAWIGGRRWTRRMVASAAE
jgi:tight adherence protein B